MHAATSSHAAAAAAAAPPVPSDADVSLFSSIRALVVIRRARVSLTSSLGVVPTSTELCSSLSYPSVSALRSAIAKGQNAREKLCSEHVGLVVSLVKPYSAGGLSLQDLYQEGRLGLLTAADRFDPTLGVKFSTYASYWILNRAAKAAANSQHVPKLVRDVKRAANFLMSLEEGAFDNANGKVADDKEQERQWQQQQRHHDDVNSYDDSSSSMSTSTGLTAEATSEEESSFASYVTTSPKYFPTAEDVATVLRSSTPRRENVATSAVACALKTYHRSNFVYSLSSPSYTSSSSSSSSSRPAPSLGDCFASDIPTSISSPSLSRPELDAESSTVTSSLLSSLSGLDALERDVVVKRFGVGGTRPRTRPDISKLMGISLNRVRDAETRGLQKLRMWNQNSALEAYCSVLGRGANTA